MTRRCAVPVMVRGALFGALVVMAYVFVPPAKAGQDGRFDAQVMPVRATDSTARVDVYVQLSYDQLSFRRLEGWYVAEFDITVRFTAGEDSVVQERTFAERVVDTSYDVTVGRTGAVRVFQKRFLLSVGDVMATISLFDRTSQRTQTTSVPVHVPDFAHAPVSMSGVLIASSVSEVGGARAIVPHLVADLGRIRRGAFAFFEAYVRGADTLMDAVMSVTTMEGREVLRSARVPLRLKHGTSQQFVRAVLERVPAGVYTLTVSLVAHAGDTAAAADLEVAVARATRRFAMEFMDGMPATQEDLEKSVARLRWIAGPGDMSAILDGVTIEERLGRYRRFWDERDPTEGTQRNEAMELYFSRIRYANEHYKVPGTEGYATDQGMIYVIFGSPTSMENHPFEAVQYGMYHGPYQVWYYQSYNRSFVFIDQDGFGTFRLASVPPVERFQFGR
jgi:GWxTD domain-containing protein